MITLDSCRDQILFFRYTEALENLQELARDQTLSTNERADCFYLQAQCYQHQTTTVTRRSPARIKTIGARGRAYTYRTGGQTYTSQEPKYTVALQCLDAAIRFQANHFQARVLKARILQVTSSPIHAFQACREASEHGFNPELLEVIQTLFDRHTYLKYFDLPENLSVNRIVEYLNTDSSFYECYAMGSLNRLISDSDDDIQGISPIVERIESLRGTVCCSIYIPFTGSDDERVRTTAQNVLKTYSNYELRHLL